MLLHYPAKRGNTWNIAFFPLKCCISALPEINQSLLDFFKISPKFADYVGDIYHHAKFYLDQIRGFASVHAGLRAPLFTRLSFLFAIRVRPSKTKTAKNQKGDITCQHVDYVAMCC